MWLLRFLIAQLFLAIIVTALPSNAGRSSPVTTVSIVQEYGYPIEEHEVLTSDGYYLTMHRIPYSKTTGDDQRQRPVMFLMHGLLCSSSDWVLSGPVNGLAFILSDAGYDVWMGNARGNTYSKKHATKSPLLQPFWDFTFHEIGIYDLPAMIDYALNVTGEQKLQYVGHSQGTTVFFVLQTMIESYKNRITSAHLLAPIAWVENAETPLAKIGGPLLGNPNALVELFGSTEFLPNSNALDQLGAPLCLELAVSPGICSNALVLFSGYNSPYLNETMVPDIIVTTPAGASVNQFFHYLQENQSGFFRQFDYGLIRNIVEYGTVAPPNYDVGAIEVPTYLYYSDTDYFASLIDVDTLRSKLNPNFLKRSYRMPEVKWNHLDFLWGLNAKEILHNTVLDDIINANL